MTTPDPSLLSTWTFLCKYGNKRVRRRIVMPTVSMRKVHFSSIADRWSVAVARVQQRCGAPCTLPSRMRSRSSAHLPLTAGSWRHRDIPGHADDVAYQQAQHRPGRHLQACSQQYSGPCALHNALLCPCCVKLKWVLAVCSSGPHGTLRDRSCHCMSLRSWHCDPQSRRTRCSACSA